MGCVDRRPTALFTHLAVPAMTRLRQPQRQVLDTLVAAGVARSRADALQWCVRLVGRAHRRLAARPPHGDGERGRCPRAGPELRRPLRPACSVRDRAGDLAAAGATSLRTEGCRGPDRRSAGLSNTTRGLTQAQFVATSSSSPDASSAARVNRRCKRPPPSRNTADVGRRQWLGDQEALELVDPHLTSGVRAVGVARHLRR